MKIKPLTKDTRISILGLGYVGLPLAIAFSRQYATIGYDINSTRIIEICQNIDVNNELSEDELGKTDLSWLTDDSSRLSDSDIFIITAPTPVNEQNQPDLRPLLNATRQVAEYLKPGNIVIFESTVFPGATEEECVPILEEYSSLKFNQGFYVGYSPERINPGDESRSLANVIKVTSASTEAAADIVDQLYNSIISAGTHRASNIKVAEAAKVIENTQRDLNIALVNELAILFDKLDIDTQEVLEAAGSKWNFLPFTPGLVGGHCIGVDPYYLTYKAQQVGYHPEVILAGRRINDSMGSHVAERVIRLMLGRRIHIIDSRILIMGMAFKENCPDTRNSRVSDIADTLESYHCKVDIYDPWVDTGSSELLIDKPDEDSYDAIIIAVAHDQFKELGADKIRNLGKEQSVIFDVKNVFKSNETDGRL